MSFHLVMVVMVMPMVVVVSVVVHVMLMRVLTHLLAQCRARWSHRTTKLTH